MAIESYDIVGSYNNQRITSIDAERSVNLFEYLDPLGKKPKSLLSTSGLKQPSPPLSFPGATDGYRAQFVAYQGNLEFMFVVIGQYIYRIDQALSVIQLNSIPLVSNVGFVGIDANNGNPLGQVEVIFVDGENGYIYNLSTQIFTQITDPGFPIKPIDVCYLDGFFVVANGDSNQFQLSAFNEGLIWSQTSVSITSVDSTSNIFTVTLPDSTSFLPSGTPITFSGTGTLPANVVAGTTYYVINLSPTTFSISTSPDGPTFTVGTGFVAPISATNSGQLQLGTISSHPGNIVACRTLHRRLFLFSQNYTEIWENQGAGTNLPFRRNNGLLMEYGTPAIGSIAVGFDKLFFLSQDRDGQGSVMEVSGTQSMPVSNQALDYAIAQYASNPLIGVSDARAFLIKENGLIFYRLNFTLANHTYVYGVTTSDEQNKRWHEEEVLNGDRHPAQTHGYFYGRNYVGNYKSSLIYIIDDSYSTNDSEPIRRMRIGRPQYPPTGQRIRIDRFQLDLLQGQIFVLPELVQEIDLATEDANLLITEDANNIIVQDPVNIPGGDILPVVFLSVSKDGGQSYGYRIQASMGSSGQRTFRTVWRKLGATKRGQAFVPKIEFFNEIPFIILGADWVFEILPQ